MASKASKDQEMASKIKPLNPLVVDLPCFAG